MRFTEEEIALCRDAMAKPAPIDALRLIASGRVLIELTKDRRDVYIDSIDGRLVRDPDHLDRKMLLSGAWPLYRAGMIDDFGIITEHGRALLAQSV
ncbi:hypothetical protein [Rhizobium sp. CECT 9324]|jgi:hypothetical protein|uniref:hypothetical protein n=1 Tax=Rhizobium sp. CECT 9324 TaxID=2845820 RepID=UPI001E312D93|nr:hypothetical protein [Rhizobium sp. CECT 9324]CAH0343677.1 hypothetical protein RHI9324_05414 [Rhizobium sp. CECT 9324]